MDNQWFTAQRRAKRQKFYTHRAWRRIRTIQLRKHALCEHCHKRGRQTVATVCDHIDPTWESWQDFIAGPFQSLCESCHREKTEVVDLPKLKKQAMLKLEVWE